MKPTISTSRTLPITAALASIALSMVNIHAATILIDYNDGLVNGIHDTAVRNGGFETATLSGSPVIEASFADTANWTNLIGNQATQAVRENNERSGLNNGVLDDANFRNFGNDTGHTLTLGEIVNFSYFWKDASGWEDASDQVQFSIFTTTNDTLLGTRDQTVSKLSGISTTNSTYQAHADSFTIGAAMNGKRLFISIQGKNFGSTPNGFAAMDDVYVEVIPEPSAALLSGLGMLALLRRRR